MRDDFAFCFRSILSALSDLYWIVQHDSFGQPPVDWADASTYDPSSDRYVRGPLAELEDLRLDSGADYHAYAPGVLPRFAPAVTEDWNELFGFRERVDDLQAWVKARWSPGMAEHVAATAVVCFLNADNAYWEVHSNKAEIIDAVRSDMETEASVVVVAAKLEESFGL